MIASFVSQFRRVFSVFWSFEFALECLLTLRRALTFGAMTSPLLQLLAVMIVVAALVNWATVAPTSVVRAAATSL